MSPLSLMILSAAFGVAASAAFVTNPSGQRSFATSCQSQPSPSALGMVGTEVNGAKVDPKEAIKIFGRLAEDWYMNDPTGGLCCYAGCRDCAHRNADGSYKLTIEHADQAQWIPTYVVRFSGTSDEEIEHSSKWGCKLFSDMRLSLTKEDFLKYLTELEYMEPDLCVDDGPEVLDASEAAIIDLSAAEALWDFFAQDKKKLTRPKMNRRMKEMGGGGDIVTWTSFEAALGVSE